MKFKLSIINLLFCLIYFSEYSYAQTFISGAVSGTWTKEGSPYNIIDNASVSSGNTLNIEPGVSVIIGKDLELSISGEINAVGSDEEPVIFRSPNDTVYWNRIITYSNGSVFKNCVFSEAKTGIYMYIGCVCSSTNQVEALNCTFQNCSDYAIYGHSRGKLVWNGAGQPKLKPIISNCKILNSRNGIYFYLQGAYESTPYGTRRAQGSVYATITNNIFKNIQESVLKCQNQYGTTSEVVFENNNLINCFRGISTESPYDVKIRNNIFSGQTIGVQRTGNLSSILTNNCFYNTDSVYFIGYPEAYGQIVMNNINGDPCDIAFNIYTNPLFNDSIYYNLSSDSPCIDAGKQDTTEYFSYYDMAGKIRVWDGTGDGFKNIDIGALEYGAPFCLGTTVTENVAICAGEDYNGWTETGMYVQNLTNVKGCDSIVTTNLTVNNAYEIDENVIICEGESYLEWSEPGIYQRELISSNGCDSIVITNLHVNPIYYLEKDITICSGSSYNGWNDTGQYVENLISLIGCDSTVITNLTVTDSYNVTENISICEGESYEGWEETGEYQRILTSSTGYDSIITTSLTVHDLPNPDFTFDSDTVSSLGTYSSYQWYNQNGAIESATSNRYAIAQSGTYYLEVTDENGCSAMSEGINVVKTGIDELSQNQLNIVVIPNPNDGKFMLRFENGEAGHYQVKVINELGQIQLKKEIYLTGNVYDMEFELSQLPKGNYYIKISEGQTVNTQKIIIQ